MKSAVFVRAAVGRVVVVFVIVSVLAGGLAAIANGQSTSSAQMFEQGWCTAP